MIAEMELGNSKRFAFYCMGGLLLGAIIPLWQAGLWLALSVTFSNGLEPGFVRWIEGRSRALSTLLRSSLIAVPQAVSSIVVAGLIWLAIGSREPLGYFMAATWVAGAVMHCFVYYVRLLPNLIATVGPSIVTVLLAILSVHGLGLELGVCALSILGLLGAAVVFSGDRHALLDSLAIEAAARAQAEETSAQKSRFIAHMSHELRTPLNAVIGYAEMLEEGLREQQAQIEANDAARIRRAGVHLLCIINEILDISKIEAGQLDLDPAWINLEAVAYDTADLVRPLAEARGNRLRVQMETAPRVRADPQRLRQCLLNLLSNACKFTENGEVGIRVFAAERPAPQLRIAVADTGAGIAPEEMAKLFQPFVQLEAGRAQTQGTGLGLVITRQLMRLMGGDVEVESQPGQGSVFTLVLPLAAVRDHADARLNEAA